MAEHRGDTHAGGTDREFRGVEDLPRLVGHLQFFLGVAIIGEVVDLGDGVEGDLLLLGAAGLVAALKGGGRLSLEPFDGGSAGAGHGLVSSDDDALQGIDLVDGEEGERHRRGRAVGLTNDPLVPGEVGGIDLRDDQRHGLVHPEGAGVVDNERALFRGNRCVELRGTPRSTEENDVVLAIERTLGGLLDGDGVAPELDLLAR